MTGSGTLFYLIEETSDPARGDFFVRVCRDADADPAQHLLQPMQSAVAVNSTIVLVLPFLYCAHRRIEIIPGTDTDYLRHNLPYHLEDELVDAVEDVCVFWKVFDTYIEAFVVAKFICDALEKQCVALGLVVENVLCEQQFYLHRFPDPILLKLADCLLCVNAGVIVKSHNAMESFLLTRMGLAPELVEDKQHEHSRDFSMELVSEFGNMPDAVSLLGPERKRSNRIRQLLNSLVPVSKAIAVAMVLIAIYQGTAAVYFIHKSRQLNEQSQIVFQQKFGASKSFADMEALAKTQLKQGKTIAEYEFLAQFQRLAQAWHTAAAEDIKLESVRFHSTKGLTIQLQFKNFDGFERLSQQLKSLGEMELKEMSYQDNITRATIQFL
jgi:type II secretory pathway component PulL